MKKLLIINPGSTSTKIGVYEGTTPLFVETIRHTADEINSYKRVADQFQFRKNLILELVKDKGFEIKDLDAVVGRGGLMKPIKSGTYEINDEMINDVISIKYGEHASNLGALIAKEIGDNLNIPSFIVDPVVVDELLPIARISGSPEIERVSIFHALNQKAVARRYAKSKDIAYEDLNLIVVHMGGGVSIGAHKKGMVIDVNNALNGEGPMSPERSGSLPVGDLTKLCFSGKYTQEEIGKKIVGKGGVVAHLGTNDMKEVNDRMNNGDEKAKVIFEAMAYQTGKEIGSAATVLKGQVDAIILTGGIVYSKEMVKLISDMVSFIAPVVVYPGEDELLALAEGGLRVLNGEAEPSVY
ncbi:MAG: butyrate kinase [Clostridiaceae bacterium]